MTPPARSRLTAVAIAVVTVVVFARLTRCGFTDWDDAGTVWGNPYLNPPRAMALRYYWTTIGTDTPGGLYTPVTYTVWTAAAVASDVVYGRGADVDGIRLKPGVFHTLNVLLHAVTAVLVYRLLCRLFGRGWPAAAGALLFALHPVQVEPVGWISGTKDVLLGLFAIAALSAYVGAVQTAMSGGRRGTARRGYLLATSLFLLSMLSKPTGLMVPPMAAAVDVLLLGRPARTAARWLWPWAALMVPCVLWTRAAQQAPFAAPIALWQRPLVATDALAFYLRQLAWPAHLCVDYGRRPALLIASSVAYYSWLLPASFGVLILWRRSRPLAAAAVLFVLPLVPVLGLVPFDFEFYSIVADHYLYLPMLGVAVAATWTLTCIALEDGMDINPLFSRRACPPRPRPATSPAKPGQRITTVVITAAVLVALAVRTAAQTTTWQDTSSLFRHVLDVNPRSFVACDQLGHVQVELSRRDSHDLASLPSTDPNYNPWRAHLERSLDWYGRALELYPDYMPALVNIATNAGNLGDHDRQRAALRRAAALQPRLPAGLKADPIELAKRLMAAHDPAAALGVLDDRLRADPTDVPALLLRNQAMRDRPGGTALGQGSD